ncbi:hypothetical protein FB45DRAFT_436334 [Roridomyces roridus]|uniref:Uncharacterized protein n=1 Tax=Roridomyces roridus TaxID=1738132 RepID=A0AAD7B157_9AGAR|nr:hypothetical protein FB45DRAFT_436334 [Roridomyces roridus]
MPDELRVEDAQNYALRVGIPHYLDSYGTCEPHETSVPSLNALLLEFDQVASTGREAFVHLVDLSNRVARDDVQLFSQRGQFIDTLNPLYDAYIAFGATAIKAHAFCAEYLLLRRNICRASVPLLKIDEAIDGVLVAFSRCVQEMTVRHAEVIEAQWKATTEALRVAINPYCIHPAVVSIIQWVDSRNAARFDLPDLLDALPQTMQKSTDGLAQLVSAYENMEKVLSRGERRRRAGREPLASESDIEIILVGLIHLDTAVMRYRACMVIANRWTVDRPAMNIKVLSSTPFRKRLASTESDLLLKYCGRRDPSWLDDFRFVPRTRFKQ